MASHSLGVAPNQQFFGRVVGGGGGGWGMGGCWDKSSVSSYDTRTHNKRVGERAFWLAGVGG